MNLIERFSLIFLISILAANVADAKNADIVELQETVRALDLRLQKIESRSDNKALIELYNTIESLKEELQSLRGEIEQQSNDIDGVSKRQRNMYLDIDRRLNDLQIGGTSTQSKTESGIVEPIPNGLDNGKADKQTAMNADSKQEREEYGASFNFLKEGRYSEAVKAFKKFLDTYPTGRYAENAQYWLGEANYASRQFEQALIEFDKVLKTYPGSTKVPGAKLKMGYTYFELERWREAREILNDVLRNYPSSSVAPLAEKRLIRMTKEGH